MLPMTATATKIQNLSDIVYQILAEKGFWEIIGKLKNLGAEGILVIPIEKMIM